MRQSLRAVSLCVMLALTCFFLSSCAPDKESNITLLPDAEYQLIGASFDLDRLAVSNGKTGEEERVGYIDSTGTLVIPMQYRWNGWFTEDGILRTADENKSVCYVDLDGKTILDSVDNMDIRFADIFIDGYAVVGLVGIDGGFVINTAGEVLLGPGEQHYRYMNLGKGLFSRMPPDGDPLYTAVVDITGKQAFDTPLAYLRCLRDTRGFYSLDSVTFGLWDAAASEIMTEPRFTNVTPFHDGAALVVTMQEEMELIDEEGNCILNISDEYPNVVDDVVPELAYGLAALQVKEGQAVILNASGELLAEIACDRIDMIGENMAMIRKDGKYGYIDASGKEILPVKYDQVSTLYNGVGFLSLDGKIYRYVHEDKA